MKNILVLTPIYPSDDVASTNTPVVHYFTREWIKSGYNVLVVNYTSNFPFIFRLAARIFYKYLCKIFNNPSIRVTNLESKEYELDGVVVKRIPMEKFKPHGKYTQKEIGKAVTKTIDWCQNNNFKPDIIIGHWVNPQIDIMQTLKKHYNVPTCLVMHDAGNDLLTIYKKRWGELLNNINVIGYRSDAIKRAFESRFGEKKNWFYCYSGVPKEFININSPRKQFNKIRKFIFVGTLIKRKFPAEIIDSLEKSEISDYMMTYVGAGPESGVIEKKLDDNLRNKVFLKGRLERNEIKNYLNKSDVFVMISKHETFGLVYLEAMAAGCITIASKNEGFDGIIKDGVNGFLCEAGNTDELTSIINRINSMSKEDLEIISNNAQTTAKQMTDSQVAAAYINSVINLI